MPRRGNYGKRNYRAWESLRVNSTPPNVTDNHQYYNAKAVADANAAVLITEQQLAENPDALNKKTAELISDRAALCEMEEIPQNAE